MDTFESKSKVEIEKEKCQDLIDEISNNRQNLKSMLDTIQGFRKKIDTYIPNMENSDGTSKPSYRDKGYSKFLMQENMKNVTAILNAELEVRKTIENSIKNEIDLRRKLNGLDKPQEEDTNKQSNFKNIREISKRLKEQGKSHIVRELGEVAKRRE